MTAPGQTTYNARVCVQCQYICLLYAVIYNNKRSVCIFFFYYFWVVIRIYLVDFMCFVCVRPHWLYPPRVYKGPPLCIINVTQSILLYIYNTGPQFTHTHTSLFFIIVCVCVWNCYIHTPILSRAPLTSRLGKFRGGPSHLVSTI